MIFGDIQNIEDMAKVYPSEIMKGIDYLKSTDFSKIEAGRYEIQGDELFALVQDVTTKEKSLAKPEVHRKYIDIQFLVKGEELIGFARDTKNNEVLEDALEKRDVLFYKDAENETNLVMSPGSFAVFFPNDVHRPGCTLNEDQAIRKVVVKIKINS